VVPHVPFPHWKTVDKDIPVAPQGVKYIGQFQHEYQAYVDNLDVEDTTNAEDSPLPDLLNAGRRAPRPPRAQTMSTDDIDEDEFLDELVDENDPEDDGIVQESDEPFGMLRSLADVVDGGTLHSVAQAHRSGVQAEHGGDDSPPPITTFERGTGDNFLKAKGAGCKVYPIETEEEVALAETLVAELGEKPREIAARMLIAMHDATQNVNDKLRAKSPAIVQRWLNAREERRKREQTMSAGNAEDMARVRALRRGLHNYDSPGVAEHAPRDQIPSSATGAPTIVSPSVVGHRSTMLDNFPSPPPPTQFPSNQELAGVFGGLLQASQQQTNQDGTPQTPAGKRRKGVQTSPFNITIQVGAGGAGGVAAGGAGGVAGGALQHLSQPNNHNQQSRHLEVHSQHNKDKPPQHSLNMFKDCAGMLRGVIQGLQCLIPPSTREFLESLFVLIRMVTLRVG